MASSTPLVAAFLPSCRAWGANIRARPSNSADQPASVVSSGQPATPPAVMGPDDGKAANEQQGAVQVGHRRQVVVPDAVVQRFGGAQGDEGGPDQADDPLGLRRRG